MKASQSTLFICLSLPFLAYGQESGEAPDEINNGIHSISLSHQQYRETFELENNNQSLNVSGPSFQYSYATENYSAGFNYQKADDHKQSFTQALERQFALMLETEGYGVFAMFYLGQAWLGLSAQKSAELNEYNFSNRDAVVKNKNEINTFSLSLDAGYGWYFETSQFSLAGQLTQQENEQKTLYVQSRDVVNFTNTSQDNALINEDALLASMTLDYGVFADLSVINPDLLLTANINLTRIESLKGDAYIQQNNRYNLPNSQLSQSAEELTVDKQQSSTRYGIQVSLQGLQNSLTFSIDTEEGEDVADAYYSVSIGTQF